MMKWVFSLLIITSIVFGMANGRMSEVSNHAISDCANAIELTITLAGSMCLWSGLLQIAKKSGLTEKITQCLYPITSFLFKGISKSSKALELISMNITANLLGLGNAATPIGIAAIKELAVQAPQGYEGTASNHMITFVVLNTASIQLIPTTIITLRLKYGSQAPLEILPAILITSAIALFVGLFLTKLFNRLFPPKKAKPKTENKYEK